MIHEEASARQTQIPRAFPREARSLLGATTASNNNTHHRTDFRPSPCVESSERFGSKLTSSGIWYCTGSVTCTTRSSDDVDYRSRLVQVFLVDGLETLEGTAKLGYWFGDHRAELPQWARQTGYTACTAGIIAPP